MLVVLDEFTREALALLVDTSITGARVARALDEWASKRGVKHFIHPGKPVQNAYCESFNGKLLGECLDVHWFTDLADARKKIEIGRWHYNEVRPHSSLDGMSPFEYACEFNRGLTLRVA